VALGSPTHISHVLINLLVNAAHSMRQTESQRPPHVMVSVTSRDERIQIKVSDNGQGVDPQVLARIFDPFVTTREIGQGMGLGLSICHTIVRNHGGSIRVHSKPGKGAEFVFDLPAAHSAIQP
jgi:two-component system sensor histidine kinase PhcS